MSRCQYNTDELDCLHLRLSAFICGLKNYKRPKINENEVQSYSNYGKKGILGGQGNEFIML